MPCSRGGRQDREGTAAKVPVRRRHASGGHRRRRRASTRSTTTSIGSPTTTAGEAARPRARRGGAGRRSGATESNFVPLTSRRSLAAGGDRAARGARRALTTIHPACFAPSRTSTSTTRRSSAAVEAIPRSRHPCRCLRRSAASSRRASPPRRRSSACPPSAPSSFAATRCSGGARWASPTSKARSTRRRTRSTASARSRRPSPPSGSCSSGTPASSRSTTRSHASSPRARTRRRSAGCSRTSPASSASRRGRSGRPCRRRAAKSCSPAPPPRSRCSSRDPGGTTRTSPSRCSERSLRAHTEARGKRRCRSVCSTRSVSPGRRPSLPIPPPPATSSSPTRTRSGCNRVSISAAPAR